MRHGPAATPEPGADVRLAELSRAHDALQAVADALAVAHGLDEIVPTVLAIVAKTFGIEAAAYFEHTGTEGELVFLRYWLFEGRVLRADELLAADPTTPRRWVDGFSVPPAYPVAMRPATRPTAIVIDHAAGTGVPEFDDWCRAHGWELELNVPCLIRGVARGSLVLCRAAGMLYTGAEIALAEALSKQLALAVEADRLARAVREGAVEAALTRERQHAADAQAAELARSHGALQAVIDAQATARGFDEIVPIVLGIVARTFEAPATAFFERTGPDRAVVHLRHFLFKGRVLQRSELLAADPTMPRRWADGFAAPSGYPVGATGAERALLGARVFDHGAGTAVPEYDVWACGHGWPLELNLPCTVGGVARGSLVVFRGGDRPFTSAEIALAVSLANQLGLAVEADRLAQEVRARAVDAAVAGERASAADARAGELARAHGALQTVTDALAVESGFDAIVPAVLRTAARTFDAGAVGYFERIGHEGRTVVVRYWLIGDQLLRPAELAAVDPLLPAMWLGEFTVPPSMPQLGVTAAARARLGPVVSDFTADDTLPVYRDWFRGRGWPIALNVPCAVDGLALGSLVVCRAREAPYTSADVALGQGIGSQLALALQADRLARAVQDGAVESAVARERERAAEERAAGLARANATLRETANQLAGAPDLGQFLAKTLVAIAGELGADTAAVVTYDAAADGFVVSALVNRGGTVDPATLGRMRTVSARDAGAYFERVLDAPAKYAVFDVVRDRAHFWPGAADYLTARGLTTQLAFPVRLAGRVLGRISAAFAAPPSLTPVQAELVEALADQAALAIELTGLADAARTAAVTVAVTGERNALAREVHDTLAQGFSGIVMQLGAARDQLGPAADGSPALARVERLAREHLAEARRSIAALRPEAAGAGPTAHRSPASHGLAAELRRAVEGARDAHVATLDAAPEVAVAVEGTPRRLPADVELELLRVAQSALANALRHAHARQIRVELAFTTDQPAAAGDERTAPGPIKRDGGVCLTVADDGVGFDPEAAHPGRYGLVGMVERAARVGAALTVVTAPGEGTEVVAMWRPAGAR